jgi:two-component system heavy metal sensor histidine kinase CusS
MNAIAGGALCSHSITGRLSRKLAVLVMVVLAALSVSSWFSVKMILVERNGLELERRCELLAVAIDEAWRRGGAEAVVERLRADAAARRDGRLQVWLPDGRLLFADVEPPGFAESDHLRVHHFELPLASAPGTTLRARWSADFSGVAAMGTRWAWTLVSVTLAVGLLVAAAVAVTVRRALAPVRELAQQTMAISPQRLSARLSLSDPAAELRPWVDQFNALMERLERAYVQLEAFNADVAHELRTPLAALIGHTELALSRERSAEALRDTLGSNLEELQRLSAMVNDMLFLASADRGARARRGGPVSLAALAREVVEFHEATLEDASLAVHIEGDATLAVDEPLVKRALSNLIGNATRFADPGSAITVQIEPGPGVAAPSPEVRIAVANRGAGIEPALLPRIFDRFVRADTARCHHVGQAVDGPASTHHGLGLAIVAAIARMHGGTPLASSGGGTTRVGFSLAAA